MDHFLKGVGVYTCPLNSSHWLECRHDDWSWSSYLRQYGRKPWVVKQQDKKDPKCLMTMQRYTSSWLLKSLIFFTTWSCLSVHCSCTWRSVSSLSVISTCSMEPSLGLEWWVPWCKVGISICSLILQSQGTWWSFLTPQSQMGNETKAPLGFPLDLSIWLSITRHCELGPGDTKS